MNNFNIDSSTGELTVNQNVLIDEDYYTIVAKITDANGFGLSSTCSISFTVGVDPVPVHICNGYIATDQAQCGDSMEFSFVNRITGNYATGSWIDANISWNTDQTYATYYNAGFSYNNQTNTPSNPVTSGSLTQGRMYLQPVLVQEVSSLNPAISVRYTIQHRSTAQDSWSVATKADGNAFGGLDYIETLTTNNNPSNPGTHYWEFDTPGDYRLVTERITDATGQCGTTQNDQGVVRFYLEFGDAVYNSDNGNEEASSCYVNPLP